MNRLLVSENFVTRFEALEAVEQKRIKAALKKLEQNVRYPSLRAKPIQGRPGIWECRASDELRITFELEGDQRTWTNEAKGGTRSPWFFA